MKNIYTYSLLQYHHSAVLGEIINIGLIVYFPTVNQIIFIHPEDFNRVKSLYFNFPEKTVIGYFDYFRRRVKELNDDPDIFYRYDLRKSLNELLEKEFLQADSSMLQFSNSNKAILYTQNIKLIIDKLSVSYFPFDSILKNSINDVSQKKEDWIKPDLKSKIVKIDKDFIFLPNRNELSF